MSEKNKSALPSGAKEQMGQNGANRAKSTLKGARWEPGHPMADPSRWFL